MFKNFETLIINWLTGLGVEENTAQIVTDYTFFAMLIVVSIIIYFITRKVLLTIIHHLTKKSKTNWDDVLADRKFFWILAYLVPSYIIYLFTPLILESYPQTVSVIKIGISIYMVIIVLMAFNAFLNAVGDIYQDFTIAKSKPIKGYIQVIKIIVYLIGGIIILANLFGKNPLGLIGGLGAFSAVLLLVFKDPILGFVGGIQLSANNMVAPG